MAAYDGVQFRPPAPIALVKLRNRETHQVAIDIRMQIDSGSDLTLVPKNAARQIGLGSDRTQTCELAGFDGTKSIAEIIDADLLFLGHSFKGELVLIDDECGILGRNILNTFSILFDGPNCRWLEMELP